MDVVQPCNFCVKMHLRSAVVMASVTCTGSAVPYTSSACLLVCSTITDVCKLVFTFLLHQLKMSKQKRTLAYLVFLQNSKQEADAGVVISRICSCPDFAMSCAPTSIIMADGCDLCVDGTYRVSSYRTAQKYRIIGHFFPKYMTNMTFFPKI